MLPFLCNLVSHHSKWTSSFLLNFSKAESAALQHGIIIFLIVFFISFFCARLSSNRQNQLVSTFPAGHFALDMSSAATSRSRGVRWLLQFSCVIFRSGSLSVNTWLYVFHCCCCWAIPIIAFGCILRHLTVGTELVLKLCRRGQFSAAGCEKGGNKYRQMWSKSWYEGFLP